MYADVDVVVVFMHLFVVCVLVFGSIILIVERKT